MDGLVGGDNVGRNSHAKVHVLSLWVGGEVCGGGEVRVSTSAAGHIFPLAITLRVVCCVYKKKK